MAQLTKLQLKIADHRQALLGAGLTVPASKLAVPERVRGLPPGPTRALAIIRANAEAFRFQPVAVEMAPSPYPKLLELIDKHMLAFMQFGESGSVRAVDMLVNAVKAQWEGEMSSDNLARLHDFLDLAELVIPTATDFSTFGQGLENISNLINKGEVNVDLLLPFKCIFSSGKTRGGVINIKVNNSLEDADVEFLARFLKYGREPLSLDLKSCKLITDRAAACLAALPNITGLDLTFCDQITDRGVACLAALTNLSSLSLHGCKKVTDQGVIQLTNLAKLVSLNIMLCGVTDRVMLYLPDLTELASLELAFCHITDRGLVHLKTMAKLSSLGLASCEITDEGLAHLSGLTNLSRLGLSGSEITDRGLAHVAGLTNLSSLTLYNCNGITDQGLAQLTALPNLASLDLSFCRQVTDRGLGHLKALANLARLDLRECSQITDEGLAHFAALTNLSSLVLWGCAELTDNGLAHLAALTNLSRLDLTHCDKITVQAKQQLRSALPKLKIKDR
jgi:Leucine-rich repeat (LRR) protein